MNDQFTLTRSPQGSAAVFTITRPERANALSHTVIDALRATIEALPGRSDALVIAGSLTVFSAGADLGCVRGTCGDRRPIQLMLDELGAAIENAPFPVIAFLEGPCVGAAVELSLTCDARIGTSSAAFRIPATQIGVVYRSNGVENLRRRLPFVALQSLLLLGNTIPAERAQTWGLIESFEGSGAAWKAIDAIVDRLSPCRRVFAAQKQSLGLASRVIALSEQAHEQITDIRDQNSGHPSDRVER